MKDKIIYKNEKLSLTQEQLDKIVEEVYQKNKDLKTMMMRVMIVIMIL